eukprot:364478-Chlamydomonas_euryale.AAC.22
MVAGQSMGGVGLEAWKRWGHLMGGVGLEAWKRWGALWVGWPGGVGALDGYVGLESLVFSAPATTDVAPSCPGVLCRAGFMSKFLGLGGGNDKAMPTGDFDAAEDEEPMPVEELLPGQLPSADVALMDWIEDRLRGNNQ